MQTSFTLADWAVLAGYVLLLATAGWLSTRRGLASRDDYFLAGHHAPTWLVAISVLSTVQSAATFLGVPDFAYRGNFTYIGGVFSTLVAAWLVGHWLMPRLSDFYAGHPGFFVNVQVPPTDLPQMWPGTDLVLRYGRGGPLTDGSTWLSARPAALRLRSTGYSALCLPTSSGSPVCSRRLAIW